MGPVAIPKLDQGRHTFALSRIARASLGATLRNSGKYVVERQQFDGAAKWSSNLVGSLSGIWVRELLLVDVTYKPSMQLAKVQQ
jgi:hypothetical protein